MYMFIYIYIYIVGDPGSIINISSTTWTWNAALLGPEGNCQNSLMGLTEQTVETQYTFRSLDRKGHKESRVVYKDQLQRARHRVHTYIQHTSPIRF